jgi:hypothetical protein
VLEILRILPRAGHGRHFLSHGWGFRGYTRRFMKDKREDKSPGQVQRDPEWEIQGIYKELCGRYRGICGRYR